MASTPVVPVVPPEKVQLSLSQQKYISLLQKKVLDYQAAAQAELNRLTGHLQEALTYVREELGVPEGHPYSLTEDASHLIHTPPPAPTHTGVSNAFSQNIR
jgi:hypothetical protein